MSGASASESSAWKLDTSQTMVAPGSTVPHQRDSGVPTFPASATGSPASRQIAPSSSVVVVFPFVPVTATNRFGRSRQASSSSPSTGTPRSRAATIPGASFGTPGLFTTTAAPSSSSTPSVAQVSVDVVRHVGRPGVHGHDLAVLPQHPHAAVPDLASPTTRYGPSGSGGLTPGSTTGTARTRSPRRWRR